MERIGIMGGKRRSECNWNFAWEGYQLALSVCLYVCMSYALLNVVSRNWLRGVKWSWLLLLLLQQKSISSSERLAMQTRSGESHVKATSYTWIRKGRPLFFIFLFFWGTGLSFDIYAGSHVPCIEVYIAFDPVCRVNYSAMDLHCRIYEKQYILPNLSPCATDLFSPKI